MIQPIVKTVDVPTSPERAFKVFVEEIAEWWPAKTHSVAAYGGDLPKDIVFEAGSEGVLYEVLPDGSQSAWGRVTEWKDGRRFTITWHPGRAATEATRVTVEFDPLPDGRTRVRLTHVGWEVLADQAEAMRDNYDSGWDGVLGTCFAEAFSEKV